MQQGMDDELYNSVDRYYQVDKFTAREKLAIEFGERFAIDDKHLFRRFSDRPGSDTDLK